MVSDKGVTAASYGGGVFSVLSALTLTEWGILTGIVTAIGTFALNAWWGYQRNKREREAHELLRRNQSGFADRRLLIIVSALTITASGTAFVLEQEGTGPVEMTVTGEVIAKAYPDPAHGWNVPTICAGRTTGVFQGQRASMGQCEAWLIEDLTYAGAAIKRCTPVSMTQDQYNYLASLVHNIGGSAYCASQIARNINAGRCVDAARQMHASPQIDRATGKPRIWRGRPIIDRSSGVVLLDTGGQVMKWTTAAGVPLPGLIKRRNYEASGFATDCDLWGETSK